MALQGRELKKKFSYGLRSISGEAVICCLLLSVLENCRQLSFTVTAQKLPEFKRNERWGLQEGVQWIGGGEVTTDKVVTLHRSMKEIG